MKKIGICLLTFILVISQSIIGFAQTECNENQSDKIEMEYISNKFLEYFENNKNSRGIKDIECLSYEFMNEYGDLIEQNGYEAHIINESNYEEEQEKLKTNFESISLKKDSVYLILIEGDNSSSRSYSSPSFSYEYNGNIYSLRRLSVTAADNGDYERSDHKDVLKTNSKKLLENCLNTLVSAYISSVSKTLGTVASICGLNITDFDTSSESTMICNGAVNWTRVYTQVYSYGYDEWMNGSCVEYVNTYCNFSGFYYDAETNSMLQVPENKKNTTVYSSKYNNNTWKNQQAIINVINSNGVNYDMTGDVNLYYGNKIIMTFREFF